MIFLTNCLIHAHVQLNDYPLVKKNTKNLSNLVKESNIFFNLTAIEIATMALTCCWTHRALRLGNGSSASQKAAIALMVLGLTTVAIKKCMDCYESKLPNIWITRGILGALYIVGSIKSLNYAVIPPVLPRVLPNEKETSPQKSHLR